MAKFTGKPTVINRPAAEIAEKFADLTALQPILDQLPEEERAKVGDITLTRDDIVMQTPQVGQITLRVVERTPALIRFQAVGAPVAMHLNVILNAQSETATEVVSEMDVDIPVFLKAMLGGTLQKAADQFSSLITRLA